MKLINHKKRLSWKAVLAMVLVIACAAAAASFLYLMNPHTRAGYPGWQEVRLANLRTFLLPGDWQLTSGSAEDGGRIPLQLTDPDGTELARGWHFPHGADAAAFSAALEAHAGVPLSEYRDGGGFTMSMFGTGAAFRRAIFFADDALLKNTWCLELSSGDASLILWFPWCEGDAAARLSDYAKAVICSWLQ